MEQTAVKIFELILDHRSAVGWVAFFCILALLTLCTNVVPVLKDINADISHIKTDIIGIKKDMSGLQDDVKRLREDSEASDKQINKEIKQIKTTIVLMGEAVETIATEKKINKKIFQVLNNNLSQYGAKNE